MTAPVKSIQPLTIRAVSTDKGYMIEITEEGFEPCLIPCIYDSSNECVKQVRELKAYYKSEGVPVNEI